MRELDKRTIFDDERWAAWVEEVGHRNAQRTIIEIKTSLKDQRRVRASATAAGDPQTRRWLQAQAKFEQRVNARLREVEEHLRREGNPARVMREHVGKLYQVIARLAVELEGTPAQHLLDEIEMPIGDEVMTISHAIDTGWLAVREAKG